ncbi:ATP-binding protein [Streptomyces malaysiensis]|uniref:ATP-binding protein n=1 Tax=Streptomyces malaysiensis subsp. samsunensis TaxID=459658 RepID=A0A9X2M6P9_STRMQ|nr:ATP-binding protein [Streptomyces samsunensis]MCQ8836139.1 ATP-binding protein [Streptomyces samsunensis]
MNHNRPVRPSNALEAVASPPADVLFPLPHIPEGLGAVRRRAARAMEQWCIPSDLADDALLVVSELITNAVVHALPPASLCLSRQRSKAAWAVRIEVTDAGPALRDHGGGSRLPEERGRGSTIVAALSARSGTMTYHGGTTRWAEIQVTTP